jgi:predicted HicB family RNase H-like nuclease
MNEDKINPHIRVYPQTRQRLKVMAAQQGVSMQDLVERLLSEQEKREKEKGNADKNV